MTFNLHSVNKGIGDAVSDVENVKDYNHLLVQDYFLLAFALHLVEEPNALNITPSKAHVLATAANNPTPPPPPLK